jgi:hypothetical protein
MNNVQFITHQTERYSYADGVRMVLEGGCRWVQLRMKDAPAREIREVPVNPQRYGTFAKGPLSIDCKTLAFAPCASSTITATTFSSKETTNQTAYYLHLAEFECHHEIKQGITCIFT